MKRQTTGFKRLGSALLNSIAGLRAALCNETAFRQECAVTLILTPAAVWLG